MGINFFFCVLTIFIIGLLATQYNVEHHYAEIIYINKEYISDAKLYNVKPNRTSRAFSSYHCQKFEITGNSYKLNVHAFYEEQALRDTPVQFDLPICDSLNKNKYGVQEILKYGNLTQCPIKKGCYALHYFHVQSPPLPPHIPLKKYLVKLKIFNDSLLLTEIHWHGELKKTMKASG